MSKGIFAFFSVAAYTVLILLAVCIDVAADRYGISGDTVEDKVVLIVADYLSIEDINRMGFLGRLAGESHMALMNNRQPGKAGASKSKLIIGSGKRMELGTGMVAGGSDESLRNLYSIESGRTPKPNSPVFSDIYKLKKRNEESEYQGYIGYLGETIKKNNGSTCFLGNSDTTVQNRSSILITMNNNGEVDLGDTENLIKEDKMFPFGKRTDYNKLAELYKQYLPASSFMVIETGDLERLEGFRESMSETSYEAYKKSVLREIDNFVESLIQYGGFKTLVFISTFPSDAEAEMGNRLTPVVVFDTSGEGLLYSSNTRRAGLILNTDLADYLLYKLGYLDSSTVAEVKKEDAGLFLETMNRNIIKASTLRLPVLTAFAVMIMSAIVLLFVAAVLSSKGYKPKYSWPSSLIAYIIIAFPLILLYLPTSLLGDSPVIYMMLAASASSGFSLILHITVKERLKAVLIACSLQLFGLSLDILAGSPHIKQSVLGYDPVIGARFYGIGNEYAGMFIGCSLIVFGCLREYLADKFGKSAAAVYFMFCTLVLGLPSLGANFGGAAAGVSGYLLAYFLVYGIKFNKRNTSIGILILCAFPVLLIVADSLGIRTPSHLGNLVRETKENGLGVITATIQRKIAMNLRLIRYTIWTKVLICIIAAISTMFFKPVKLLGNLFIRYKDLKLTWGCIAAAAIVGFAVNDSGIVLAATAMIYVVFSMLILCIDERNEG